MPTGAEQEVKRIESLLAIRRSMLISAPITAVLGLLELGENNYRLAALALGFACLFAITAWWIIPWWIKKTTDANQLTLE